MENPSEKNKYLQNSPLNENHEEVKTGLDNWNQRLDENLEPENHNDEIADEKARNFSEQLGSGDQSDKA